MPLYVYNKSNVNVTLAGTSAVIAASPAPPARGDGTNVTSELKSLTPTQYDALEAQRIAAPLDYVWSGVNEYFVGNLTVGAVASVKIFTNANRSAATGFPSGTLVWNSDDNAPNFSDGVDWRDAVGNLT
jgi:hypothetical protein